ncbi:MAG TPA: exodeoxyribonuclease V subunit gamma [Candidatus Kapabacteria bacterium]|nr:exodeoxyribonuclease V subunit gamma [Candidatus Kapabacteria bacterium]
MPIIVHNTEFDINKNQLNLNEIISNYIVKDKIDELFIVLPTAKWQRYLNNHIVRQYFEHHKKPTPSLNIYNLSKFTEFIYSKLFKQNEHVLISDAFRLSKFEEACNKADLHFFRNFGQKMNLNLVKRLSDTIYGLKEDGIRVNDLMKDIEVIATSIEGGIDYSYDLGRLKDIYQIYKEFEYLLKSKLLDLPALIDLVSQKLSDVNLLNPNSIKELVFDNRDIVIFVYGFTDFKKPEIDFLSKFGYSNIPLAIHIDFSSKNGPLYSNMREIVNWLEQTQRFKSFEDDMNDELNGKQDPTQLNINTFLRKHLFIEKSIMNYSQLNDKLTIYELDDINNEVIFIAKLVKKLIIEDKYKANEICVVARQPSVYTDLIRNEFNKERIPHNISDRFELKSSPIITLIFNVLELITNDYHRDTYIKILKNPLVNFEKNIKEDVHIDIDNLIRVFSAFKLLRYPWDNKFDSRINYLNHRINQKNEDAAEEFEINLLKHELANVIKAKNDFLIINSKLPQLNGKTDLTSDEFTNLVKDNIIDRLGVIEKIKDFYKRTFEIHTKGLYTSHINFTIDEIEKLSKSINKFIKLLNEINYINNMLNPNIKFSIYELIERLKIAVSGEKYNIHEKVNYGVDITSIEQTRGIPYKVSILCGAFEGNLPIAFKTDSFIGKDIPNSKERHYNSEQVQFYQFLTNNSAQQGYKLFITYPSKMDNNDLVPSHFLLSLYKITGIDKHSLYKISYNNVEHMKWFSYLTNISEIEEERFKTLHDKHDTYFNYLANRKSTLPLVRILSDNPQVDYNFNIDSNSILSISTLENYNECPYKYYVSKVLKIQEEKDTNKELSSLEKGDLIHYVLFKFYNSLKEDIASDNSNTTFNTIKLCTQKQDEIYTLFIHIAHAIFKEFKDSDIFFDLFYNEMLGFDFREELGEYPGLSDNKGKLLQWLKKELKRQSDDKFYKPALFEYAFGFKKETAVLIDNKFRLRGKIDRIELKEGDNVIKFNVADYKMVLGKKHSYSSIIKGESLQMPLYMYAFKKILEGQEAINKLQVDYHGAVYYPTTKFYENKNSVFYKFALYDDELIEQEVSPRSKKNIKNINEVIDNSIQHASHIVDNINSGIFDIKPGRHCQFCTFAAICRKNTLI